MSDEQTKLDELAFALRGRSRGGFGLLVFETIAKQREIYQALEDMLPEQHFHRLDLGSVKVGGLKQAITERVPQEALKAKPGTWVVNLFGLEHSISELKSDGTIGKTEVLEDMNFKRLQLFDFPFVVLVWTDHFFYRKFREQAPDLMDWVTIYFDFPGGDDPVLETPQSEKPLPQIAVMPERKRLIEHYLQRYEQLKSEPEQYERTVREKISLLTSLGREYHGYRDFDKAIRGFTTALQLVQQLGDVVLEAELYEALGGTFLERRDFVQAEKHFQHSLTVYGKIKKETRFGALHHWLGRVAQEQRRWSEAEARYEEALKWCKQAGQENALGGTYHQLGMVAQEQRRWSEAEARYEEALKWKHQTGQEHLLGSTYHHLGMVAEAQRRWSEAEARYEEALKWHKQTGQEHALGITYHQLGRVAEAQRRWSEAEACFLQAVEWDQKTGQLHEQGLTYLNLGVTYAAQTKWLQAYEVWLKGLIQEIRDTAYPHTKDRIIHHLKQHKGDVDHSGLQSIIESVLQGANDQEHQEVQNLIHTLKLKKS